MGAGSSTRLRFRVVVVVVAAASVFVDEGEGSHGKDLNVTSFVGGVAAFLVKFIHFCL